jgi:hypothetical protein
MWPRRGAVHALVLTISLALACGGSDSTGVPTRSLTIIGNLGSLPIGMAFQLSAVTLDLTGATIPANITSWYSAHPQIATVDATGLVTAMSVGTARITATSQDGASAGTEVLVRQLFGRAVPGAVSGDLSFAAVSANGQLTCALDGGGLPYCWGLGTITPTPVPGASAYVSLATGGSLDGSHMCALDAAGKGYCWGKFASFGELGNGTTTGSETPVPISGGLTFTRLAVGQGSTCGLTADAAAYCWGENFAGELGSGTLVSASVPSAVVGGLSFVAIGVGDDHTCGLTTGGAAYCWGENDDGELGDGTRQNQLAPVAVAGGFAFASLAVGGEHVCALTSGGAVYCWGWHNVRGVSASSSARPTPVLVSNEPVFTWLAAGGMHDCAVTGGGAAHCWGADFFGQLGDGLAFDRLTLAPVVGGLTFTTLVAGGMHTCGLVASGGAYCWGHNENGELGDGSPWDY